LGRTRDAAEPAPVMNEPFVLAGRARAFHFLTGPFNFSQPVYVLRSEALGVVDIELAAVLAPGLFPVDLLATGLDDVEVEVGLAVQEQRELGVSDFDVHASDVLSPLAEPRQAEAVAGPGPWVGVVDTPAGAGLFGPGEVGDLRLQGAGIERPEGRNHRLGRRV